MLTPAEEQALQKTWEVVSSDLKGNGAKLFLRFFTDYPNYQKSFKAFANVPFDQLPGHKRFQAHAFTVMNAVDGMVQNLDDPEMLDEMLLTTGANHGRRKIEGPAFDEFKCSFVGFLETTLNEKWTPEAESAWSAVADAIISKIKDGLDRQ